MDNHMNDWVGCMEKLSRTVGNRNKSTFYHHIRPFLAKGIGFLFCTFGFSEGTRKRKGENTNKKRDSREDSYILTLSLHPYVTAVLSWETRRSFTHSLCCLLSPIFFSPFALSILLSIWNLAQSCVLYEVPPGIMSQSCVLYEVQLWNNEDLYGKEEL